MIVSSNAGYGALPIDPILMARSQESVDQGEPQTPPSPSHDPSPQAVISAQPGNLLSSSTTAQLLNLTDTAPPKSDTVIKPKTISHEDVLEAIKRSKSYASGDASDGQRLGEIYTSKDVGFVKATTGYNIISIGDLTATVDDNGNGPPSGAIQNSVTQIAGAIETGRISGFLRGEITPKYATNMINTYAGIIKAFPEKWLENALSYLGGTTDSQPANV